MLCSEALLPSLGEGGGAEGCGHVLEMRGGEVSGDEFRGVATTVDN